jgi:hypothetical protein
MNPTIVLSTLVYTVSMTLIAMLEARSSDFFDATNSISEELAAAKPNPAQWSVLECVEHGVIP